ncbi:MAG: aldo/keto reductase [Thermoguttaceae bacterium]|nr:aldo/keto reductase [Thermoguttaceae bacterium]
MPQVLLSGNEAKIKEWEFEQSLERTGAGYFDFYLLHALSSDNVGLYDTYGIWEYVRDLKARGLVRHMGFSFHDGPELLDRLLTEHPEVEFVQLQLNYADWEDPVVQSRANYEVAVAHDVPVVVMEPVKGGTLAALPPAVADIFRSADATASPDFSTTTAPSSTISGSAPKFAASASRAAPAKYG